MGSLNTKNKGGVSPQKGSQSNPPKNSHSKDLLFNEYIRGTEKCAENSNVVRFLALGDSITRGFYKNGTKYHPYIHKLYSLLKQEIQMMENQDGVSYGVDIEIMECGKNGETTGGMLSRLKRDFIVGDHKKTSSAINHESNHENSDCLDEGIKLSQFDYVIVLGGLNDCAFSNSSLKVNEISQNIADIHDYLHQFNFIKRSFCLTVPVCRADLIDNYSWYNKNKSDLNDSIREYATQRKPNVVLVDIAKHPLLNIFELTEQEINDCWDDSIHYSPAGYDRLAEILFESMKTSGIIGEITGKSCDSPCVQE